MPKWIAKVQVDFLIVPSFNHFTLKLPIAAILFSGNFLGLIKSFADAETGKVFNLAPFRKLPGEIQTRAKVKLDQPHQKILAAPSLPPRMGKSVM